MEPNTPCWLVVNPASGSNDASSAETVAAALTERGWRVDRVIAFPTDPLPDPQTLDAAGIGLVVIYTGDGTMGAVINRLAGWSGTVMALPGGTMNLLPLRLHRSTNLTAILDLVAGGGAILRRPECVRCEAGVALAGLLVGPGTAWSRVRESMRAGAIVEVAKEAVAAIRQSTSEAGVLVEGSRLMRDGGYPLIELTPGEHGMQIDGYYADAPLEYAGQAWSLLRRRFREGPHDRLGLADSAILASVDGTALSCLLDGEPAECPSGSRFTVEPCGVQLLVTAHEN
jgi:Diacylglycerol kinase catalytic domain